MRIGSQHGQSVLHGACSDPDVIAAGFSMFYHTGELETMKIKEVPGVAEMPDFNMKFNLPAVHFFKIRKGEIYEIEANGASMPYGVSVNWE